MYKNFNILQKLGFSEDYLNSMAVEIGFIKRVRKLNALDYLQALLLNVSKPVVSYNTMASSFIDLNKSVFKQSLHKAMNKSTFLDFIQRVFNELLHIKLDIGNNKLKLKFDRIIVQDSTVIKLPQRLFKDFSGVKNKAKQVANARVQIALDIRSNTFNLFSVDSYSKNDLSAANELDIAKGDLIIRDRGYFRLSEIIRIKEEQADFIYRYRHSLKYCDPITGDRIDILKLLKNKSKLEISVKIGNLNSPIVKLFAVKVNEQIACKRRTQLRKNTKRHTPGKELLQLQSWTIFITSIDEEISFEEVFDLYRLRWRIEIIFKGLKSHLNFGEIHNVSRQQLTFILMGKMILLLLTTQFIYNTLQNKIRRKSKKALSLLKLIRYLKDNIQIIPELLTIQGRKYPRKIIENIIKYCSYEDRKKRTNHSQQLNILS